jgi:hypothetical protein
LEGYDEGPAVGIAENSSAMLEGNVVVPDMPIVEAGRVWCRFRDWERGRTSESLASKSGRYQDCPPRRVEISVRKVER